MERRGPAGRSRIWKKRGEQDATMKHKLNSKIISFFKSSSPKT